MKKCLLTLSLVLFSVGFMLAQRAISGTVTDESGEPLIGANVVVKGTTIGTVTDLDGNFEMTVPEGADQLEIRYLGYETRSIDLGVSNTINVSLSTGAIGLEEVVTVAYGQQSKRTLVSSISTLDEKEINSIPAVGPQEVLQGQVSGVQMVNSSGVLGAAPNIRIRGVASLTGGGSPLFVVDGVPLLDNGDDYSDDYGGGASLNPLLNIPTSDIESISVLKDASAAALYGSRGSNGVVLITTKKGQAGRNNINVGSTFGFGTYTDLYEMANSEEFYGILERYNPNVTVPEDPDFFDWQDNVVQNATTSRYNLSFDGGTDKTQYYLGGSYSTDQNYVIGNDLERYAGRLNLTHRIGDNLKFGANVSLSKAVSDRISTENSTYAPLTSSYLQNPSVKAFNEDGSYARTGFIANVIAIEETALTEFGMQRTTGNTFLQYIIPNLGAGQLVLKTDWGVDLVQTEETFRFPDIIEPGGSGSFDVIQDNKWLTTNTIKYTTQINSGLNLSILGGQSFETARLVRSSVASTGFAADALRNTGSGANPTTTDHIRTEWALSSFFTRAQLDLDNKYFMELSARRDGSSRFGADNRYGNFWAAAAGWDIAQENFMTGQTVFDQLKLRVSYGLTGNDRIGNFASLGLFQAGVLSDYAGMAGLRPIQAANPDLKWEQTKQFDIGVNMRLFNAFTLGVSYYDKLTEDLLLDVPLAFAGGIASITRNVGSMQNRGVDIDFSLDVVNNLDWNVTFGGNISFVNNEILDLGNSATEDQDGNRFIIGSNSQRAVEGMSANEFFLIRYNGINAQTGDAEWLTKDGELTTTPSAADRVFVGSAIPDFVGGLNFSASYKGLTISALANYTVGNFVMLDGLRFTENPVSGFNKSTELLDYWQQPGDNAFAPAAGSATANTFSQRSTSQLQDGSFLRLRNVTLAYDLPVASWNMSWLQRVNVFVRGINLVTVTASDFRGQDPEVSDSGTNNQVQGESFFVIPQRRMVEFGINVTF